MPFFGLTDFASDITHLSYSRKKQQFMKNMGFNNILYFTGYVKIALVEWML